MARGFGPWGSRAQAGRALPTRARERIRAASIRGAARTAARSLRPHTARAPSRRGRAAAAGWTPVGGRRNDRPCHLSCRVPPVAWLPRGARHRSPAEWAEWAGWVVAGAGCVVVPARERRRRARCARALHGAPLAARAGGCGPSLSVRGRGTRGYSGGYGTRSRDLWFKWFEGEYEEERN